MVGIVVEIEAAAGLFVTLLGRASISQLSLADF